VTALLAGGRKADIVATTLRAALQEASLHCPPDAAMAPTLVAAARALGACSATASGDGPTHPDAPTTGQKATMEITVSDSDTAAGMGHPDAGVDVLGSPRIALWFELSTVPLMPPPGGASRHVGTGLVVHHLGAARVGQTVTVEAVVMEVMGPTVVFACQAITGDRVIATGVHQRIILDAPST
jgi:predicted thioesterase